jgi:cystathionine beta-lyase
VIRTQAPERLRLRSGRKWRRHDNDVLAAWIADMDFEPAPPIARTLLEALVLGDFGYGPTAATSCVAEAFAAWAERRWGWTPDPGAVMLAPDVVGALANCIEALTEPGDAVLVQTPAYPPLLSSVRIAGRELVEAPLDNGLDDALLQARKVRMILLCHPHNPTGRVFSRYELALLAALAERHDLVVVSDEVHADLTFQPHVHLPFAPFAPERTVTLNAPSKAFNVAGLRTAVCVAPPALRARLSALPPTRWNAFSTLGVRAALAAWSEEGAEWLDACVDHLAAMRDRLALRLAESLPQIGYAPPAASYLAWLDCRALNVADPAAFFLEHARVALSPGPEFGAPGDGFARLNFATSAEILDEIVDRMAQAAQGQA